MYFTVYLSQRGEAAFIIILLPWHFKLRSLLDKPMHDKEVMRASKALVHGDRVWYPAHKEGKSFRAEETSLWLIVTECGYLLELHFSENMSCVVPMRGTLNDKGKTCYAILNSPSSSMQITLSCCSLFFQRCSSKVDLRVSPVQDRKLPHTH